MPSWKDCKVNKINSTFSVYNFYLNDYLEEKDRALYYFVDALKKSFAKCQL